MSEANKRTIETYNNGIQDYIDGTAPESTVSQKEWLGRVLSLVDKETPILEIGSASGRDANYLIQQGYRVDTTDGTPGFVKYLNEHGFPASELNIVERPPEGRYDVILALAVFIHFTDEDFVSALKNVWSGLNDGGKFIFTLKQGEGEVWSTAKLDAERFFRYWRRNELESCLEEVGFSVLEDQSFEDSGWLYVVAEKQAERASEN